MTPNLQAVTARASGRPVLDPRDRVRGAIMGQLVGDAAALGSHWIYDLDELDRAFPGGVAGFEEPPPGHYHHGRHPGAQTHYGDGLLTLLRSVTDTGRFDPRAFGRLFVETFDRSRYDGYLDHATLGTLANFGAAVEDGHTETFAFQSGADDDQPATATRLSVLVGRSYREQREVLAAEVEALTRVTQVNARALVYVRFSAVVLIELLAGRSVGDALDTALDAAGDPGDPEVASLVERVGWARVAAGDDVVRATLAFGQSCPLQHSVPSAVQVLVTFPDDLEQAVVSTLQGGGDNAARAAIVGGWLGARLGVGAIPQRWLRQLSAGPEAGLRIERLIADADRR